MYNIYKKLIQALKEKVSLSGRYINIRKIVSKRY